MRQLLEKWSMEGHLQDLEDGLMSIGRKDLISGMLLKRIRVMIDVENLLSIERCR